MTEAIELGPRSQWHHTASRSPTASHDCAVGRASRARAEDEATVREASLDLLAVAPGARVLDVGCWSGVVTRTLRHVHAPPCSDPGRALGRHRGPGDAATGHRRRCRHVGVRACHAPAGRHDHHGAGCRRAGRARAILRRVGWRVDRPRRPPPGRAPCSSSRTRALSSGVSRWRDAHVPRARSLDSVPLDANRRAPRQPLTAAGGGDGVHERPGAVAA
jgi:hypothetical protein